MKKIYVVGSMKNPRVTAVARELRKQGYDVFDDWFAPGPEADDYWQSYARERGQSYKDALNSHHAKHVFSFDKYHLDQSEACVLVLPAGKSGHLELGYMVGKGIPAFILFDGEPERFDIMYRFATDVFYELDELILGIREIVGV